MDIETRLEELAQLQDGWLDGNGRALNRASLMRLVQAFGESFDPDLPLPYLYPTPEGGVQAEWTLGRWEVSLEIILPSLAADYQAVHTETGETREQVLSLAAENGSDWTALNNALTNLLCCELLAFVPQSKKNRHFVAHAIAITTFCR